MIASIIATINLLLACAELPLSPGYDAPLLAVALAAAVVVTVAVVLLVVPGFVASAPLPSARPIDPSALVAQSDPDAAGHPRPRAPGLAIPVA